MGYQEIFEKQNAEVKERFDLMRGRIASICTEETVLEKYRNYFQKTAEFLCLAADVLQWEEEGKLFNRTIEECEELNEKLYADILPKNDTACPGSLEMRHIGMSGGYEDSYANPRRAVALLGEEFGKILCFLYTELRSLIGYAFEGRKMHMTIFMELFVEVYNCFESEEEPDKKEIEQIIYWFFHDYSEVFAEDKVRDMVDPEYDFFTKIILESDLSDLRYLYRYGAYISNSERKTAEFLNALRMDEITSMADTMTEGFRIGYQALGKDLSQKETVCIEYPIGFERIVRAVILNFDKLGLKPTIYRCPSSSFGSSGGRKRGCYVKSVNRQFEFDHRADSAFYLNKAFVERRLEAMQLAFETYKTKANRHAGPAVTEIFGEEPFAPVIKPEASKYSGRQNELKVYQASRLGEITNAYIPGDERSFTIIAYPIPSIGERFEEIFRETVKVNTLDYLRYRTMQQKLIDALDGAQKVHITGRGGNRTDLWVGIHPLLHPERETAFENCVADVNIPVGEVFTSPVLEGTNGKLHVTQVYLNELKYLNLELDFKDGMISRYTCTNFDTEEENQKFLYENLLQQHKTLPMGEFAIGTNTTAYKMARDYQIADKLPILIAEKTGPHFAVGDTCYSHAEDTKVYNPDGKEVIARDNAVSILRKQDMSKAYFNCHTDITIPYDELDAITAVMADGSCRDIIRNGKFAVEGTEELNLPLDE